MDDPAFPRLRVHDEPVIVARYPPHRRPELARGGPIASVTQTATETSVVCAPGALPEAPPTWEGPFRVLEVVGPIPFETVGLMAHLTGTLAAAGVTLLALSTFDTDYVLVRGDALDAALEALRDAGYRDEG